MPELPALPLWDILNLNGITDVVGEYVSAILPDVRMEALEGDAMPLTDPYAEI